MVVWRCEWRCERVAVGVRSPQRRLKPVRRFRSVSFDTPIEFVAVGRHRHINDCDTAPVPTNFVGSHLCDIGKSNEPADERRDERRPGGKII